MYPSSILHTGIAGIQEEQSAGHRPPRASRHDQIMILNQRAGSVTSRTSPAPAPRSPALGPRRTRVTAPPGTRRRLRRNSCSHSRLSTTETARYMIVGTWQVSPAEPDGQRSMPTSILPAPPARCKYSVIPWGAGRRCLSRRQLASRSHGLPEHLRARCLSISRQPIPIAPKRLLPRAVSAQPRRPGT